MLKGSGRIRLKIHEICHHIFFFLNRDAYVARALHKPKALYWFLSMVNLALTLNYGKRYIFRVSGKGNIIDLSSLVVLSPHFSKHIGFCLLNKDNHWQYSQFRHIIKHEMNQLWNKIPKQFAVLIILNWSKSKVHPLKNTKLSPSSTKSQRGPSNKKTWHIISVDWFGKKKQNKTEHWKIIYLRWIII